MTKRMNKPLTLPMLKALERLDGAVKGKYGYVPTFYVTGHYPVELGSDEWVRIGVPTIQALLDRKLIERRSVHALILDDIRLADFERCNRCDLPIVPDANNWYWDDDGVPWHIPGSAACQWLDKPARAGR